MSDPTLLRLARWAASLDARALPPGVERRLRLRLLSCAGAVRQSAGLPAPAALLAAGPTRGSAALVGAAGTRPRREALRFHVAAAEALDFDDLSWAGPAGSGAVGAAWAFAAGLPLERVLSALAVGVELAARFNAATLLGPRQGQVQGATQALATAATTAHLMGLGPEALAAACGLALAGAAALPGATVADDEARGPAVAAQALLGFDAAEWAARGLGGPSGALDAAFDALACAAPLRRAFEDPGEVWHTEALTFKLTPGAAGLQVPVEATHEILRRHVKAAEKRLRPDQIDRIDLRVAAPGWAAHARGLRHPGGLSHDIARSVGALVAAHDAGAEWGDPGFQAACGESIAHVAARVHVRHYLPATLRWLGHLNEAAQGLLSGLPPGSLGRALDALRLEHGLLPAPAEPRDLVQAVKARPDQLLAGLGGPARPVQPSAWRLGQAVELKLYTSRGGWWPERRDAPDGSNAHPIERVEARVIEKFARGDADRARAAAEVLALPLDAPGDALLDALRC